MALMIDRRQLAEAIDKLKFFSDGERAALLAVVYSVPAVDAVLVVRGQWEEVYTCNGEWLWGYRCNQCNAEHRRKDNYCPKCGAKMD